MNMLSTTVRYRLYVLCLNLGQIRITRTIDGFPSLIAALSARRKDKYKIMELLLSHGADTSQRGVNDYSPLHYSANDDDPVAIELLLSYGADATARTNIDDFATSLEEAENLGRTQAILALRKLVL